MVINEVYDLLKTIAPTQYIKRGTEMPSLSYRFINISNNEFSEDECIETNHSMQIDIWSQDCSQLDALGKKVKTLLKNNDWNYEIEFDDYDKDTEIYQRIMRFSLEEEVV